MLDFHVVVLQPLESIASVVVVDHSLDVGWVVAEVAEIPGAVVSLLISFVEFIAQISGE